MKNNRLLRVLIAVFPSALLLFAYSTGPEPRHTAAPGDDPLACSTAGCHVGTPLNSGGGSVKVDFPNGLSYVPGVQQTITITITDAQSRVYGFQMSARLESNQTNGQAGDFTAGPGQIVICDNGEAKGAGCPANNQVQFIEHFNNPFFTNTMTVKWTPPATDAGNVHIYVAGNAANGDGNNTGDHIYTAHYVLVPQGAVITPDPPKITSVVSAGAFNPNAGIASGTWLEIYGTGLAATARPWALSDFTGTHAPTQLDGVGVTINGIPAFISYASPTQLNVQAPDDPTTGPVLVQLANGKSNALTVQKSAIAPALLAPPAFNVGGKQFVVALFPDQAFVGKAGLIDGLTFRPAKSGDIITIYAIGCGPVTPAIPAGTVASGQTDLQNKPTFRFGGVVADLKYGGLAPDGVGLYQFNIVVPAGVSGDVALTMDAGGVAVNQPLFITIAP